MIKFLKWFFNSNFRMQLLFYVLVMIYAANGDAEHRRAGEENPRRPEVFGDIHISESPQKKRGNTSNGTAWAVDNKGNWLTAKHVVNGCTLGTFLDMPTKYKYNASVLKNSQTNMTRIMANAQTARQHPSADIATIVSEKSDTFFALGKIDSLPASIGMPAYAAGFPGGKPGEAMLNLLGASIVVHREVREPVLVWAIKSENTQQQSLAGISGGPVLDTDGDVIGVAMAENLRRGRLYTPSPSTIKGFYESNGIDTFSDSDVGARITKDNYKKVANELRERHSIVMVLCLAHG